MIETIIKRDGTREPFSPDKINKWGEWAAKTLGTKVDWASVVLQTVSLLPTVCTSKELQEKLIKTCIDFDTWSYNKMAGRLYAALVDKEVFPKGKPTVKELHQKLQKMGLMVKLNYSDEDYAFIESMITHKLDLLCTHFELKQCLVKYSIQNRVKKKFYETPQFTYMRMAMALSEDFPEEERMTHVREFYERLSRKKINAPTPNYLNLGTALKGYFSCCLYTAGDSWPSLAVGDHIGYAMTCMSAGIGSHLNTRSLGDPVRGGAISHMGKLPYYRSMAGAIKANLQAGRGGACTTYFNGFDPEAETISLLKNPKTPKDRQNRDLDYNLGSNKFFARKVARKEPVFTFNCYTAPDLYDALYGDDPELFEELYKKYEDDPKFKKVYVDARFVVLNGLEQAYETGRSYLHWIDEMNFHTPFKDKIYLSNLCAEICEPVSAYQNMADLYSSEDHGRGEIALCALGAINVSQVENDEDYAKTAYYTLLMIDKCIGLSDYAFPHLELTAKARMNAGVGMVGLAHLMAKKGLKYSSQEGKDFIHGLAETHMWHLINASLELGKKYGNAKWMHKTKWPEGWLPIDTYNRNVDKVVTVENQRDWEGLRGKIIANKGIRNSVLCAYMPSESSSIATGTTNSIYPVRELTLIKSDNGKTIDWAAPEGDRIGDRYEFAWDIKSKDMIDVYAIIQKWTDQSISADLWRKVIGDDKIKSSEMINDYLYMTKMGLKTRYYQNTLTTEGTNMEDSGPACAGGSCTL